MICTITLKVGWQRILGAAMLLVNVALSVEAATDLPTEYRRVLVPADKPLVWPRNGEKFLPVESSDFNAWIAAANRPPAKASITDAEYHARLEGQSFVGASGRWQVALRGEGPARLPLSKESPVIQNARWSGEPPRPAQLGLWAASGDQPTSYALQVANSGELNFDWHAPPLEAVGTALEVTLRLPTAVRTRLVLDLPLGKRPEIVGGIILSPSADASNEPPHGYQRWKIGVGSSASAVLRIVDAAAQPTQKTPASAVDESSQYNITSRGIDLETRLRLDASESPMTQLAVTLPAGLQLIEATASDQKLAWTVTATGAADGPNRATIHLPAFPASGELAVVLHAWGTLQFGESRQLPKLSVDGIRWTSGSIELAIDGSLELCDLTTVDCVQTSTHSRTAPPSSGGCLLSFQSYSPQGAVELAVRPCRASGRVRIASSLQLGNSGADGRLAAEIVVDKGSLYALSAELQPGWSIDGVESIPADAVGEWYVDGSPAARRIEFQLNRAVTPGQPIQIVVTGRARQTGSFEPRTLNRLGWLTWRDLEVERSLLQLTAAEPFKLDQVGDLQTVAPGELSAEDRRLIGAASDAPWFDLKLSSADAAARISPQQGTYDAELQLDATLSTGELTHIYRVDCRPRGGGIDHVLMYVSEPLAEPLQWVDAQSGEPLVAQRMPANDPRLGGLPPGGELWLLHLGRLYARPVAITATRTATWPERRRVPLVALPDAAEQRGRVVVASDGVELPTIVAERMQPTPLPTDASDVRAVYRYQPVRFYDAGPAPELWLGPSAAGSSGARLIATMVDVESHYTAAGSGTHRITYRLENQGATDLELRLPSGVNLNSAQLDGETMVDARQAIRPDRVAFTLPPRRRIVSLELELESQQQPLTAGGQLLTPLPTGPLTILQGEWTIWLPQDFAAVGDAVAPSDRGFDWRARLFGPLARPLSQLPFNPLNGGDWNSLWASVNFSAAKSALAAEPRSSASSLPDGWHAYQIDFAAAPPAAVTIAHPPAVAAWSLAIFLVALVGTSLCGLRATHVVSLALFAAAISLLLPATVAPLATGAVIGLLLSQFWQWARPAFDGRQKAFIILAAGALLASANSYAAEPVNKIERVLIPVDANGKPAGRKYFVSEQFLRQLLQTSSERQAVRSWLLLGMRCDGELVNRPESPGLKAGEWTLNCEVETFSRDTTIELPLVEQEADWPAAALADGIPAPIAWNATGRHCSIRVAEPGRHQISIPLRPRVTEDTGRQQVELSLPPVARAIVKLTSPVPLADLSIEGAARTSDQKSTRTIWQGELDGSGRLTAHWTDPLATTASNVGRHADELLWLRIQPTGLELHAKFVLLNGDWPADLDVCVDRRWELIAVDRDAVVQAAKSLPNGQQLLRFELPQAKRSQRKLHLRFRSHASPLGRLRLPAIGLAALSVENCQLAVSWDPALECEPSPAAPSSANAIADFAAAWGESEQAAPPQMVLDTTKLKAATILAVRPRTVESTYRELLSLTARRQRLDVVYQAEVTPAGGDRFRWSLAVPPDLAVQAVSAEIAGKPVSLNWVRVTPDRVNAFFAGEVTAPYRLRLVGSTPVTKLGPYPIPRITAADRTPSAQTVALYRTADILAEWKFAAEPPAADAGAAEVPPTDDRSRLVRAYLIDPTSADAIRIRVEPNQPAANGETLTTLTHEHGAWVATLACQMRVERGELDTLRLRVPASWSGPFEVAPAAATEITPPTAAGQNAILAVHLSQPAQPGETVALKIRSPLALADGQLPAAPQIVALIPGRWQQFLALPTSVEGEPVAWTHLGIEPATLPNELQPIAASAKTQVFRVATDAFHVALRQRATGGSTAGVRLAETATFVDPVGGQFAVTRFIIVPQDLSQCVVELPGDERLVHVVLDGHPALTRLLDERRWQLQLGPPNLPQTLQVVSRSVQKVDPRAQFVELQRPVLTQADRPIPIELSLWTLYRPTDAGKPRAIGAAVLSPAELAALRLDRMVSISQSATRSVIESPVVDGYNWYTNWSQQLTAAVRAAEAPEQPTAAATAPVRVTPPDDDALGDANKRAAAWKQEMEEVFADAEPTAVSGESRRQDPIDPWQAADSGRTTQICLVADGGQDHLGIEFEPVKLTPIETRLTALVSIFALAAAVFWIGRTPAAMALIEDWPQAVAIVLGVAAWAWLRPSALGLLIAVIGVGLLLRRLYGLRKNVAQRIVTQEKSPRHDNTRQSNSIPEESA